MKITKEQLKKIIKEELEQDLGQSGNKYAIVRGDIWSSAVNKFAQVVLEIAKKLNNDEGAIFEALRQEKEDLVDAISDYAYSRYEDGAAEAREYGQYK